MLSFPFMCTLESGFLLYFMTTSLAQFLIMQSLHTKPLKDLLKIPDYLPGTKLDRMVIFNIYN